MERPSIRPPCAWLALLVTVLAVARPAAAQAQVPASPFTSLTVFGDSFSDTGNLFLLTGGALPPSPPYAPGRVSNGPVWVDYFATRLGLPADANPALPTRAASGSYAVAGARTAPTPGWPPSTAEQLGAYVTRPGGTADATGLYVVFAGSNDLLAASTLTSGAERLAAAEQAARNVAAQAGQLSLFGAQSILVPFLPNLGLTPQSLVVPGRPAILGEMTMVFNAALAGELETLRLGMPTTTIYGLHLDHLFTNVLHDVRDGGERYGFTNATSPCLPPFAPSGAPSCDVSVFSDALHPTTNAHALIAAAAYDRVIHGIDVSVVPEPATVVLVGGGLLLLGIGAVRRRAA